MQQAVEQREAGWTGKQSAKQHPAWLQHEISKAQQRKQQVEQYEQQQQHKHQLVTQQATKTRNTIRATPPQHTHTQPHTIHFIDNQRPATATASGRAAAVRGGEKSKPKWAMTSAEEEKEMEAECEELVGFVEELDFDQWMEEMEERGSKREGEEEKEQEQKTGNQETVQEKKSVVATLGDEARPQTAAEWDENLPRPPTGIRPATQSNQPRPHTSSSRPHTARPSTSPQSTPTDNTETLVASLLHSSPAIRNIHSSHSLRALISSTHNSSTRVQQSAGSAAPVNSVSVAIPAPLVSMVATRDTMHGKVNPSLLPYLHRHPAV